jgi:hypothetical protein
MTDNSTVMSQVNYQLIGYSRYSFHKLSADLVACLTGNQGCDLVNTGIYNSSSVAVAYAVHITN